MTAIILTIVGIYLLGLLAFYAADGWYRFTSGMYGDDAVGFILAWPLTMWFLIATGLRAKVEEARRIHDAKVEEQRKIRVAAEKELAATMKALEKESQWEEILEEEEVQPKKRKRAR